jgi:large subunit ribosomal protein L4
MPSLDVKNLAGDTVGSVDLDEAIFGIEPNPAVMHQVVTAQLAAKRSGTQSTKTRAEVRGGGALGPKPRSYAQRTPKKMVRLALRSALSDRFASERIIVIDAWGFDVPKTKTARVALEALGATGKVLAVITHEDANAAKSMANLPNVHVLRTSQLNTYDVLNSDWVVFTRDALPTSTPAASGATEEVAE